MYIYIYVCNKYQWLPQKWLSLTVPAKWVFCLTLLDENIAGPLDFFLGHPIDANVYINRRYKAS